MAANVLMIAGPVTIGTASVHCTSGDWNAEIDRPFVIGGAIATLVGLLLSRASSRHPGRSPHPTPAPRIAATLNHVLLVGLLAVLAGCGSPSHSPAVSATPVRESGVLGDVDAAGRTVSYLQAELFVGDAAEAEAAKDGRTAPNPFYVREGAATRTLPLATDALVTVLGYDAEGNFSPVALAIDAFLAHDRSSTPRRSTGSTSPMSASSGSPR